jgi:mannose/fructose/N-acetylgalactosamine-specific phosphotransferase system component IIC
MTEWIGLLLLGGIIGLDATSFPQVMLSRPLVAGTLTGLLYGDPTSGALVGGVIEVFHLSILPIGAARYPEAGTAAVAATAAYVHAAAVPMDAPALLFAVLLAFVWERVGAATANRLRRYNERFALVDHEAGGAAAVEWHHRAAMATDFARGAAVVLAGAAVGIGVVRAGTVLWSATPLLASAAITVAATATLGSSLAIFGGWHERHALFLLGILCGSLLLLVL